MEKKIEPIIESYNVEEEYLYKDVYMFIKGVATAKKFNNTLKALPMARRIHSGQYRKGDAKVGGKIVKLPYIMHCLKVCSTLISLDLPLSDEELDILYAAGLLHDAIEDRTDLFPKGGIEFYEDYGFPMRLVDIIHLLSKHTGADEYELSAYFNGIKKDKIALLIKLADRSHNVEDLYNMKNIPKYIDETRKYFLDYGICTYGKDHYPELSDGITILKSKILSLTEATETLLERHNMIIDQMTEMILNEAKPDENGKMTVDVDKILSISESVKKRSFKAPISNACLSFNETSTNADNTNTLSTISNNQTTK